MFVALSSQHEMRMRRIVVCTPSGSKIVFQITSLTARFSGGGEAFIDHNACFDSICKFFSETFLIPKEFGEICSKMSNGLHVKYRHSCQILTILEFSRQIFEKSSNIKFRESPSSGNLVDSFECTDRYDKAKSRFTQCWELA